jgi:hypothetical protein
VQLILCHATRAFIFLKTMVSYTKDGFTMAPNRIALDQSGHAGDIQKARNLEMEPWEGRFQSHHGGPGQGA